MAAAEGTFKGEQVRHFAVEADEAQDAKCMHPNGSTMFLSLPDIILSFKVPNRNGKTASVHKEIDLHGYAMMSMASVAGPGSDCKVLALLAPASEDSEDDVSSKPITFTLKEFKLSGTVCRKIKVAKSAFCAGSVATDGKHVVVILAHKTGSTAYVYNYATFQREAKWPVSLAEPFLAAFQPGLGTFVVADDHNLARYDLAGTLLVTVPMAQGDIVDVVATANQVVVATGQNTIRVMSPDLTTEYTTWTAGLTASTTLMELSDGSGSDSDSSGGRRLGPGEVRGRAGAPAVAPPPSVSDSDDEDTSKPKPPKKVRRGKDSDDGSDDGSEDGSEDDSDEESDSDSSMSSYTQESEDEVDGEPYETVSDLMVDGTYLYVRLASDDVLVYQ